MERAQPLDIEDRLSYTNHQRGCAERNIRNMNGSTDEVPKRRSSEKPPPLEGYHSFTLPKHLKDKLLFCRRYQPFRPLPFRGAAGGELAMKKSGKKPGKPMGR
jgi:hypothetical protein